MFAFPCKPERLSPCISDQCPMSLDCFSSPQFSYSQNRAWQIHERRVDVMRKVLVAVLILVFHSEDRTSRTRVMRGTVVKIEDRVVRGGTFRCIEHLVYCKAAQFVSFTNRTNGLCELHPVNSVSKPGSLHPDANLDPLSTVYEFLETCPTFATSDMATKLSENMRDMLEKNRVHEIEERTADVFNEDGIFGEESHQFKRNEGYALMRTIEDDPKNPFDEDRREILNMPIPLPAEPLPLPITPVQVLHQGRCTGLNCPQQAFPIQVNLGDTYVTPSRVDYQIDRPSSYATYDRSPCPARQGDPCAPRPCQAPQCAPQKIIGHWSDWSPCSVSCGEGLRTRQCLGEGCVGPTTQPCYPPCPKWAEWAPWSPCSVSCGEGERRRARLCTAGRCEGPSEEMERCSTAPCPEWTEWGAWESCSVTCGSGRERRFRRCERGLTCPGPPVEERMCVLRDCPRLGPWTEWTACTASCGVGEKVRLRECIGNGVCEEGGPREERLLCNQQLCPDWTQWTAWSTCNTCIDKDGTRIRNRVCLYEGRPYPTCPGPAQDQSPCPQTECPEWTEWDDWTECSQPCGQGSQKRRRACKLKGKLAGGCRGPAEELRFCQEWGEWGGCSVTCGIGTCTRKRKCMRDELLDIPNLDELEAAAHGDFDTDRQPRDNEDSEEAKAKLIARSKRLHGEKHKPLAQGLFPEIRRHPSGILESSAAQCDGPAVEHKPCDAGPCCGWREWSDWGECDGCVAGSVEKRHRKCTALSAMLVEHHSRHEFQVQSIRDNSYATGGNSFGQIGVPFHNSRQFAPPQNINGLSPIVPVNQPQSTHYVSKRHVSIYGTRPACECEGVSEESRQCTRPCLQVDPCEWTSWGQWCGCSPCRPGREVRRRFCERPGRRRGMYPVRPDDQCRCEGNDTEERNCPLCNAEVSSHQIDQYVPIQTEVFVNRPSHGGSYVLPPAQPTFPSMAVRQIEVESSTYREVEDGDDSFTPKDRPHYTRRESKFATTLAPTTQSVVECRWSRWSAWSQCQSGQTLKQRSRFCFGANEPQSPCECPGLSIEETACDGVKEETAVEFAVRDTVEGSGQSVERDADGTICEWTPWSQWSDCTVTCGKGEKIRRKRCPCGGSRCGGGVTLESEVCEKDPCPLRKTRRSTKTLPVFPTAMYD